MGEGEAVRGEVSRIRDENQWKITQLYSCSEAFVFWPIPNTSSCNTPDACS